MIDGLLNKNTFKDICGYFPASGKREIGLGPIFRPVMNSDQYRFQILLFQIDVLTLS